jgi:hypothetical protein
MIVIFVFAELMFLMKDNSFETILCIPRNTIIYVRNQTHICYQVIYHEPCDLFTLEMIFQLAFTVIIRMGVYWNTAE